VLPDLAFDSDVDFNIRDVWRSGLRHAGLVFIQNLLRACNYSLQIITLQKPDRPSGLLTPALVTLETILGPVQAALLALAIRRKFMR
jgi:hypothetical protein